MADDTYCPACCAPFAIEQSITEETSDVAAVDGLRRWAYSVSLTCGPCHRIVAISNRVDVANSLIARMADPVDGLQRLLNKHQSDLLTTALMYYRTQWADGWRTYDAALAQRSLEE